MSWRDHAACAGRTDWPFRTTRKTDARPNLDERDATRVCAGCPVIDECAAFAAAIRPPYGVWAGRVWRPLTPITGHPLEVRA